MTVERDISIRERAGNAERIHSGYVDITGANSGNINTGCTGINDILGVGPRSGSSADTAVIKAHASGACLVFKTSGVTGAVRYNWSVVGYI